MWNAVSVALEGGHWAPGCDAIKQKKCVAGGLVSGFWVSLSTLIDCERSEHLWLRVEGPEKQIQIVAAQMLSVNFYMPHILAISQSFLTKT